MHYDYQFVICNKLIFCINYCLSNNRKYFLGFQCPKCPKVYKHKNNLNRHMNHECGRSPNRRCPFCNFAAYRRNYLRAHVLNKHNVVLKS